MLNENDEGKRGRPVNGSEPKGKFRGTRIEESLDYEFVLACQKEGVTISDGIRSGIILFIKYVAQHHYY